MTRRFARTALVLVGFGCAPAPIQLDDESSSSSGGASTTVDPGTASMTGAGTTASTGTSTTTTDPSTTTEQPTTTDVDSGSFIVSADESEAGSEGPQPLGGECMDAADCESGFCLDNPGPGPGRCSECLMDADCGMGTCSFEFGMGFAVCTDGELGDGCDSDEGCMGELVCSPQFGGDGFSPTNCSECGETAPCAAGVCSPFYDGSPFEGYLHCVDEGTVESGDGCPVDAEGVGDGSVCTSGICGVASFMMGNVQLGVCSECDSDDDCVEPMTCDGAHFMMMAGLLPGTCV